MTLQSMIEKTSQELDNLSFDNKYQMNAIELMVENEAENALTRQKAIATEAKQEDIKSLIETLQELTQRLAPLAGAIQAGGSAIRVAGVTMPSTAVTGPITSAQSIAEKNPGGVSYPQRTAQENLTAISNINNVTI